MIKKTVGQKSRWTVPLQLSFQDEQMILFFLLFTDSLHRQPFQKYIILNEEMCKSFSNMYNIWQTNLHKTVMEKKVFTCVRC